MLVDNGKTRASDYPILEKMVLEQAERFSNGLGCLVVIPASASSPPDDIRQAISAVLARLAPKLKCLCWLVEGSGFRAAAVRAALAGMRILNRPPYPTMIASDLVEALRWVLPRLSEGSNRLDEIATAVDAITRGRNSLQPQVAGQA